MVRRRQSVIAMEENDSYMEGNDRLIFWFDRNNIVTIVDEEKPSDDDWTKWDEEFDP
jgi:hypothetical protein